MDGQTFFQKNFFFLPDQEYIYMSIPISIIFQIPPPFWPKLVYLFSSGNGYENHYNYEGWLLITSKFSFVIWIMWLMMLVWMVVLLTMMWFFNMKFASSCTAIRSCCYYFQLSYFGKEFNHKYFHEFLQNWNKTVGLFCFDTV